jgi:hypothetical protein
MKMSDTTIAHATPKTDAPQTNNGSGELSQEYKDFHDCLSTQESFVNSVGDAAIVGTISAVAIGLAAGTDPIGIGILAGVGALTGGSISAGLTADAVDEACTGVLDDYEPISDENKSADE